VPADAHTASSSLTKPKAEMFRVLRTVAAFRPAPADIAALQQFMHSRTGIAFQALYNSHVGPADSTTIWSPHPNRRLLLPNIPDTATGMLAGALGVSEETLPPSDSSSGREAVEGMERSRCPAADLPVFFVPGLKVVLPVQVCL
jgi:hypothetical protein